MELLIDYRLHPVEAVMEEEQANEKRPQTRPWDIWNIVNAYMYSIDNVYMLLFHTRMQ